MGKSCLLLRFVDDSYTPSFITTIGIDFKIRTVEIDGKRVKLQIWDTAGQERFRTITTGKPFPLNHALMFVAYYRGAMGILLVFDLTDERSFNNLRTWIHNVEQYASAGVSRILVGNKCDMAERRAVDRAHAEALAAEYGMPYIETSAKARVNVEEAFMQLARDIKKRVIDSSPVGDKQAAAGNVKLDSQPGNGESMWSSCCGGGAAKRSTSPTPPK